MLSNRRRQGEEQIQHTRTIRGWVEELLAPGPDVTVMVSELTCSEPGCPPVETVIALLGGPAGNIQYKIHRPRAAVTRDDVVALRAGRGDHHDDDHD